MKITSLKLWNVPLTSHEAYYMADGKTCDTVTSVISALETDAGITPCGIPEADHCSCETALPVAAVITSVAIHVVLNMIKSLNCMVCHTTLRDVKGAQCNRSSHFK